MDCVRWRHFCGPVLTRLKNEFSPEHAWFETTHTLVDLGYQDIQEAYKGENIEIPHKKPRKSEKNPNPTLTAEQKTENQILSRVRVFVENAISGIKRFNILVYAFRNRRTNMEDDVSVLVSGISFCFDLIEEQLYYFYHQTPNFLKFSYLFKL